MTLSIGDHLVLYRGKWVIEEGKYIQEPPFEKAEEGFYEYEVVNYSITTPIDGKTCYIVNLKVVE